MVIQSNLSKVNQQVLLGTDADASVGDGAAVAATGGAESPAPAPATPASPVSALNVAH